MLHDAWCVKVKTQNEEEIVENLGLPTRLIVLERKKGIQASPAKTRIVAKQKKMPTRGVVSMNTISMTEKKAQHYGNIA